MDFFVRILVEHKSPRVDGWGWVARLLYLAN
jgi:hypothetical protein